MQGTGGEQMPVEAQQQQQQQGRDPAAASASTEAAVVQVLPDSSANKLSVQSLELDAHMHVQMKRALSAMALQALYGELCPVS